MCVCQQGSISKHEGSRVSVQPFLNATFTITKLVHRRFRRLNWIKIGTSFQDQFQCTTFPAAPQHPAPITPLLLPRCQYQQLFKHKVPSIPPPPKTPTLTQPAAITLAWSKVDKKALDCSCIDKFKLLPVDVVVAKYIS